VGVAGSAESAGGGLLAVAVLAGAAEVGAWLAARAGDRL